MIRIGKLTDYAFILLEEMGRHPQTAQSAHMIANSTKVPEPTAAKILKVLSREGLIQSLRGVNGGYRLKKEAQAITVLDVIEAMEGRLMMVECLDHDHTCHIGACCPVKGRWGVINNRLRQVLAEWSISEFDTSAQEYRDFKLTQQQGR